MNVYVSYSYTVCMKMKVELFSYTFKNHQFLGHINVRPIFVPQLTGRYIFLNQEIYLDFTGKIQFLTGKKKFLTGKKIT